MLGYVCVCVCVSICEGLSIWDMYCVVVETFNFHACVCMLCACACALTLCSDLGSGPLECHKDDTLS